MLVVLCNWICRLDGLYASSLSSSSNDKICSLLRQLPRSTRLPPGGATVEWVPNIASVASAIPSAAAAATVGSSNCTLLDIIQFPCISSGVPDVTIDGIFRSIAAASLIFSCNNFNAFGYFIICSIVGSCWSFSSRSFRFTSILLTSNILEIFNSNVVDPFIQANPNNAANTWSTNAIISTESLFVELSFVSAFVSSWDERIAFEDGDCDGDVDIGDDKDVNKFDNDVERYVNVLCNNGDDVTKECILVDILCWACNRRYRCTILTTVRVADSSMDSFLSLLKLSSSIVNKIEDEENESYTTWYPSVSKSSSYM